MMMLQDSYFVYTMNKLKLNKKMKHCVQIKGGCLKIDYYKFMIQQIFPPEISYRQVIPKGFPSVFKQWNLDPMTSNKQWVNNDIVRFNFMNLGKGVFDPFKSYLQFTISCNPISTPVGGLQIDNSAQSLIQQMVLYSNSKQIQRINDYSVLAAYLNDVGLSQMISQGRQTQGLGFGSFDTMPQTRSNGNNLSATTSMPQGTFGASTTFPTIPNAYPSQSNPGPSITSSQTPLSMANKIVKGHITSSNVAVMTYTANINNVGGTGLGQTLSTLGYASNVRAEYFNKFIQNKFPQSTSSIPNYELIVSPKLSYSTKSSDRIFPFYFNEQVPYQTLVRQKIPLVIAPSAYNSPINNHMPVPNKASLLGFNNLYTPFFARGTFQPLISPTIPQNSILQGVFAPTKIPIFRRKFKLPVLSAVIGVLIDPSQFILIPLQSINSAMIQLTLDPYAFFTTGYSDVCQYDNIGMKVMQRRNYVIERIEYKLQTYFFVDKDVEQFIQTSLFKQITIVTNFWAMSNQYQIPGGTPPNNTYIVGCNSTHLNQMVCLFVSNDYQNYSFCRKHYRLSNNITKFWSKLAVDYWPPQPYKGNAGNVASNQVDYDNSVFVQNIYWSGNYMFSKSVLPRINAYNFALNQRPYDVKNKSTFYNQDFLGGYPSQIPETAINADTAMGMSWIHENRCVGKAAFVITYTPFQPNDHVLQGINVSGLSNFEAIFQTNGNFMFPRDQTLYIFTKSTGIVKYGSVEIKTYGRG